MRFVQNGNMFNVSLYFVHKILCPIFRDHLYFLLIWYERWIETYGQSSLGCKRWLEMCASNTLITTVVARMTWSMTWWMPCILSKWRGYSIVRSTLSRTIPPRSINTTHRCDNHILIKYLMLSNASKCHLSSRTISCK